MEMLICAGRCFQATFYFDEKQLLSEELIVYFSMEAFGLAGFMFRVHTKHLISVCLKIM